MKNVINFNETRFTRIPNWAIDDETLTHRELRVYIVLCRFASNEYANSYASSATIAKKARMSRNLVFASLRRLEDRGYIRREARHGEDGRQLSNMYYILEKT